MSSYTLYKCLAVQSLDYFSLDDIDTYSADQHKTRNDLLHVRVKADIGKSLFQENDDIRADHCTVNGSVSAGSGHAADDRAADGIQLHTGAGTRLTVLMTAA